jgi:signal transduction histidine kinase/DNA-binding response OmpR family regulator/ligand-binding sensor domain-containing protein
VHKYYFNIINTLQKSKIYLILLPFCLGTITTLSAQTLQYKFKHFSIDDGLSQNMVTSIIEDHNGYLWFGTKDGLNRYDGYTFKIYKTKPFDANSISDNYITSLYEDTYNNLWIGTIKGGVHVYDEEKDSFRKIRTGKNNETESVTTITGNRQNEVWISFAQGKITYIKSQDKIHENIPAAFSKTGFYHSHKKHITPRIESIFLDSENLLWIAGNSGIMIYDTKTGKPYKKAESLDGYLVSFNGQKKKTEKLDDRVNLSAIDSRKIWEDENKNIWITTIDRLIQINKSANRLTFFDFNLPGGKENSRASGVISKANGASAEMWVALHGGILTIDMADTSITHLPHDAPNTLGLVKSRTITFYKDRTKNIWLGSNGDGISFYSPFKSTFTNGLPEALLQSEATGKSIASMLTVKNNNGKEILLLGTYDNLIQVQKDKTAPKATSFESLHGYLTTRAMAIDSENNIWMDGMSGIIRYNPETKTSETFPYLDSDSSITSILPDSKNNLVWYTSATILYRFDHQNKSLEKFSLPNYSESVFSDKLHAVLYQDGNIIWIGTADGLVMFDTDRKRIVRKFVYEKGNRNSISSAEIKCIYNDPLKPDKYIWIGTGGGGLNRFDKETQTFIHYTTDDGLPNNTIYGILGDETGNLWLSTNRGLSVFNITTETFTNFDASNGLQSNEFNTGAYFKAVDGEMFFGGINGFNRFYPKDIVIPKRSIPIVISNMELQGRNDKENLKLYHKSTNHLAYNQNSISITLASLDFAAPEKISYAYRIKNQDTTWISLGTNRNITLTNLSPGTYVFQARGTDSYSRWGNNIIEAVFVISPPWWQTWWAYSFYLLTLAGIITYFWSWNKKQLEDKQKREEELRKTEAIMEMDKIKSRFLANISHEFRTPLTLIKGHIEVLKEGSDIATQRKFSEMENNSDHILHLINQLLDLSKMESGEYKLIFRQADVLADIKRTVYSFHSLAEQKGITLSLEILPEAEYRLQREYFTYSQEALTTILNNLISNAFKFTDEGKICISLKVKDSTAGKRIFISVSDTGSGIQIEDIPKIFDRFYQVDSSMSRRYEGSGIGLALVKELAILHGGDVEAESTPGAGTTFTIVLTEASNGQTEESAKPSSINEKPEVVNTFAEGIHAETQALVLVVEDNDDLRKFIFDTLGDEWQCLEAINGNEGFQMAQQLVPDLIVSDVMMPGMDGFELCAKLKQHESTCHIPVILLTAKATQTDRLQGLETGADDYLAKPFSTKELQVRIQNLLRNRRILRQKFSASVWMKPEEMEISSKDRTFLQKLMSITEQHIQNEQFGVETLASEVGLSSSQLNRKLKALTNESALYFIRNIRMQKALQLLRTQADNITGVAYETGFENPNYFSKVFKRHFGFLPSDKEKLNSMEK